MSGSFLGGNAGAPETGSGRDVRHQEAGQGGHDAVESSGVFCGLLDDRTAARVNVDQGRRRR